MELIHTSFSFWDRDEGLQTMALFGTADGTAVAVQVAFELTIVDTNKQVRLSAVEM